ncbi:MAG: lytic transglycosylase domain-containing protein [Clostridia bacterium]|nr:lytic transglycosylase domain-containing protein [Clostridia bacterium]
MRKNDDRKTPILVIEIIALVIVFAAVTAIGSSASVKEIANKASFPKKYIEYVRNYSLFYGVDENLVFSIIKAESNFDPDAVSRVGAIGLMQIMPSTYEGDIKNALGLDVGYYTALSDPRTNIMCGVYYFSHWLDYFGKTNAAIAAYNAGPGTVMRWLDDDNMTDDDGDLIIKKIPYKETRKYVSKVNHYLSRYNEIYGDEKTDTTVVLDRKEVLRYAIEYGRKYKVDYNFVMAVIETESSFRPYATAPGTIGLMQMKPSTYEVDVAANLGLTEGPEALYDAKFSVMCGTYYLHWLDWRLDGIATIAAAYNGGIGTVRGWLADEDKFPDGRLTVDTIPDDWVKHYVEKILRFYEKSIELDGEDMTNKFEY